MNLQLSLEQVQTFLIGSKKAVEQFDGTVWRVSPLLGAGTGLSGVGSTEGQ